MPYMIAVSLEMSDEPKIYRSIDPVYPIYFNLI